MKFRRTWDIINVHMAANYQAAILGTPVVPRWCWSLETNRAEHLRIQRYLGGRSVQSFSEYPALSDVTDKSTFRLSSGLSFLPGPIHRRVAAFSHRKTEPIKASCL